MYVHVLYPYTHQAACTIVLLFGAFQFSGLYISASLAPNNSMFLPLIIARTVTQVAQHEKIVHVARNGLHCLQF